MCGGSRSSSSTASRNASQQLEGVASEQGIVAAAGEGGVSLSLERPVDESLLQGAGEIIGRALEVTGDAVAAAAGTAGDATEAGAAAAADAADAALLSIRHTAGTDARATALAQEDTNSGLLRLALLGAGLIAAFALARGGRR